DGRGRAPSPTARASGQSGACSLPGGGVARSGDQRGGNERGDTVRLHVICPSLANHLSLLYAPYVPNPCVHPNEKNDRHAWTTCRASARHPPGEPTIL